MDQKNDSINFYGKNDFKTRWGDRKLKDNWRWSDSKASINANDIKSNDTLLDQDSIFSVDYYIGLIPNDKFIIDSLNEKRNIRSLLLDKTCY